MTKKVFLATLFSAVLTLAIVGLTTEKTMAKGGFDDAFWMETGESMGALYDYTVGCTIEVGRETSGPDFWGNVTTIIITQTRDMPAKGCALVSTQACTPYSPC